MSNSSPVILEDGFFIVFTIILLSTGTRSKLSLPFLLSFYSPPTPSLKLNRFLVLQTLSGCFRDIEDEFQTSKCDG